MKTKEYQTKELLRQSQISTPRGGVATSVTEVLGLYSQLGFPTVIKAQVLAGGRGKAGGAQLVNNEKAAQQAAETLLCRPLPTGQSGGEGLFVRHLSVEEAIATAREIYLAFLPDPGQAKISLLTSLVGGVAIEQVVQEQPEALNKVLIDPLLGIQAYQLRRAAASLGLTGDQFWQFQKLAAALYKLFVASDLLLLEINPLALTTTGSFCALDAKIEIDDNTLYRHPELAHLYNRNNAEEGERILSRSGLPFIPVGDLEEAVRQVIIRGGEVGHEHLH